MNEQSERTEMGACPSTGVRWVSSTYFQSVSDIECTHYGLVLLHGEKKNLPNTKVKQIHFHQLSINSLFD